MSNDKSSIMLWAPAGPDWVPDLSERLGAVAEPDFRPDDQQASAGVVAVVSAADADVGDLAEILPGFAALAPLAVIVSDAFLGTDVAQLSTASRAAGAVAIVRSLGARRTAPVRANVIAVPAELIDPDTETELRGPLAHRTDIADLAAIADYLLSDDAGYLTGQVIFANGGRHLFSALTA